MQINFIISCTLKYSDEYFRSDCVLLQLNDQIGLIYLHPHSINNLMYLCKKDTNLLGDYPQNSLQLDQFKCNKNYNFQYQDLVKLINDVV